MPYRRLPNTDSARIRALDAAIETEYIFPVGELALSYRIINEAKSFVEEFRRIHTFYQQSFAEQVKASRKFQEQTRMARMYISHFIQVLNLAAIRKEVKPEQKRLYGLDPYNHTVPDLTSENALLEWGEKIIRGENERIRQGGLPIYNPTIAKIKVHYEIFKDSFTCQKILRQNTDGYQQQLVQLRKKADEIILEIWNQAEKKFQEMETEKKIENCKKYGIVYYNRRSEKLPQTND